MDGAVNMQEFKAWMAETILTGTTRARLWWYDDLEPGARVFKNGVPGSIKMQKLTLLTLVKCTPTPLQQSITLSMSMRDLQNGLLMPDRLALLRDGVNAEVWYGEPRFLTKPKEKLIYLFFTIEGDYD